MDRMWVLSVGIEKRGSGSSCIPPDMLSFKPVTRVRETERGDKTKPIQVLKEMWQTKKGKQKLHHKHD